MFVEAEGAGAAMRYIGVVLERESVLKSRLSIAMALGAAGGGGGGTAPNPAPLFWRAPPTLAIPKAVGGDGRRPACSTDEPSRVDAEAYAAGL